MKKLYVTVLLGMVLIIIFAVIERDMIDVDPIDSVVKAESISVATKTAPTVAKTTATADKTIDVNDFNLPEREQLYRSSLDLFAYALELLESAKADDAEAQYYLSKILAMCRSAIGERVISEHDHSVSMEISDFWYSICAGFDKDNFQEFGTIKDWMNRSAKGMYGPSILVELVNQDELIGNETNLIAMRNALSDPHPDTIMLFSAIAKNKVKQEAWKILACEYGYDCSVESKEMWRVGVAITCAYFEDCPDSITFPEYIETKYTAAEFQSILDTKNRFKRLIDEDKAHEMTFELLLH